MACRKLGLLIKAYPIGPWAVKRSFIPYSYPKPESFDNSKLSHASLDHCIGVIRASNWSKSVKGILLFFKISSAENPLSTIISNNK
ncbi:hypothetical protein D3C71_1084380 [compost metagenome]